MNVKEIIKSFRKLSYAAENTVYIHRYDPCPKDIDDACCVKCQTFFEDFILTMNKLPSWAVFLHGIYIYLLNIWMTIRHPIDTVKYISRRRGRK